MLCLSWFILRFKKWESVDEDGELEIASTLIAREREKEDTFKWVLTKNFS